MKFTITKNRQKPKWLLLLLFILFTQLCAHAQGVIVSGTVTDETGQTLPGVNLKVKGTTIGTPTDVNGKYSLRLANASATLVFSYLGYVTQEIPINGQTVINVQMVGDPKSLKEVVVIGYGTQKRETVTGSIATIKAEDFNKGVTFDPLSLIQGKVAGLAITHPNGSDPTQIGEVQLRGATSIQAQANPLIVIDGIPSTDSYTLSAIAPADIASIDVLRDGSAAAIYGSRATGGVIIVTTKKGQGGPTKVTYSGYVATDQITKQYQVLSGPQFIALNKKLGDTSFINGGANTNWFKALTRKPLDYGNSLNISGGTDKTYYSASINYQNYQGLDRLTDRRFINGAMRFNTKAINDHLDIAISLTNTFNYSNTSNNANYYGFGQALNENPTYPVYNPDGTFFETPQKQGEYNPVANLLLNTYNNKIKSLLGNIKLTYNIIPGLNAAISYAYNHKDNLGGAYTSNLLSYEETSGLNGQASRTEDNYTETTIESTLQYSKAFGKHNFDVLGGYSYVDDFNEGFSAGNNNFTTNAYLYNNLSAGGAFNDFRPGDNRGGAFLGSYASENVLLSYFGRILYNYDEKYLLNASIRREGSSKLGADNKWQTFPGISGGWVINKEDFMKDVDVIKNLKLRVGYGVTGNQGAISPYLSLATIGPYPYGTNYGLIGNGANNNYIVSYGPNDNANPNLTWETKKEFDLGLDFTLFNSQWLSGAFDFYNRTVNNLLGDYTAQVPGNIYPLIIANAGKLTNKGFEFTLNTKLIKTTNFGWNATFVSSYNENKIVSISSNQFFGTAQPTTNVGISYNSNTQIMAPGYPVSEFYGPVYKGLTSTGDWLFESNSGGVEEGQTSDTKNTYLGNSIPKVNLGLTNYFHYKNFDFSFLLRSALGFKALNAKRIFHDNLSQLGTNNLFTSALNTKVNAPMVFSSYYLENGNYLKIDNLNLAYSLKFKSTDAIKQIRFSATVSNLATITGFSGLDPELGLNSFSTAGVERNDNYYPRTRSYTFGISADF